MSHEKLVPGRDHPISVTPTGSRVTVRVGDVIVAETDAALTLRESNYPPVQYIPIGDVDRSLLRGSATTTYCPYKGDCNYYDLIVAGDILIDAVWTYREAYDAVAEISDHVAFYPGRVQVDVVAPA